MDYGKLSPALAAALADFETGGRPALALHARSLGLVSMDAAAKPPRIVVFVHCDEGAAPGDLAGDGVEINQPAGAVRTGIVDLAALDALETEVRRTTLMRVWAACDLSARPARSQDALWSSDSMSA